jgi:transcriptional regulator with XRE-family HTH domain
MQYGEKIRTIRELRGLSQENVATLLGIAQNSYSKIETNHTKLTTDIMKKLADILDVSPMDIISGQPTIVNFQANSGTQNSFGYIENYIANQKEMFEKMLASKDEEIFRLNKLIESFIAKK